MALMSSGQVALKRSLSVKDGFGGWLLLLLRRPPELNAAWDGDDKSIKVQQQRTRIILISDDDDDDILKSGSGAGYHIIDINLSLVLHCMFLILVCSLPRE